MESWMLVPLAVLVIGLAVITYGALRDRAKNQAEIERINAISRRTFAGFDPNRTPDYLDAHSAREPVRPRSDVERVAAADLDQLLSIPALIDHGWCFGDWLVGARVRGFVTDDQRGLAIVADARILLIDAPLNDVRLAVTVLDRARTIGHPMVIIAPDFSPTVLEVLEINHARGVVDLIVVAADPDAQATITHTTGATSVSITDLQADYLPAASLGHATLWVSSRQQSWCTADPASAEQP